MKNWLVHSSFLLALLLIVANCKGNERVNPFFPCSKRIDNPYGATVHFAHKTRDFDSEREQIWLLKDLSVTNVRFDFWIPYTIDWRSNKNVPIIAEAEKKVYESGLATLGILFLGWKNQRAWENIKLYKEYLDYLMNEYGDKVNYWEVFNEIDMLKKKDSRTAQEIARDYMNVLPLTYKRIKEKNSRAVVTSCSFSNMRTGLLETLSQMNAFDYFDVLNYHSYDVPEALPNEYKVIRFVMDKYGWNKPVWLTEYGFSTYVDSSDRIDTAKVIEKERLQAQRLPRAIIISLAYGIDKIFFYNLRARENSFFDREENFGVLHKDLTPKKAYMALKTLTRMLPDGSSRPILFIEKGIYKSEWTRPDGKKVHAYWNANGKKNVFADVGQNDVIYNCMGEKIQNSLHIPLYGCVLYSVSSI